MSATGTLILNATIGVLGTVVGVVAGTLITRWLEQRRAVDHKALAFWRVAFDRPAFKGLFTWQSDQAAFKRAIGATLKAVTTGVLVDSAANELGRGEPKAHLRSKIHSS